VLTLGTTRSKGLYGRSLRETGQSAVLSYVRSFAAIPSRRVNSAAECVAQAWHSPDDDAAGSVPCSVRAVVRYNCMCINCLQQAIPLDALRCGEAKRVPLEQVLPFQVLRFRLR
jgi:hypothetical protein